MAQKNSKEGVEFPKVHYTSTAYISLQRLMWRYYSACVMNFEEFYSLLAMLLSHVVVHISILSPLLFGQSIYIYIYIAIYNYIKSKDFLNICNNDNNNNNDNIKN